MNQAWWRKWHRWVGFVAGAFLLFASVTGVLVAVSEFFGEEEARREATRGMTSGVTTTSGEADLLAGVRRAVEGAARQAPGAPVDAITIRFKGEPQTVDVFLGRPGGGEDRRLVFDARTGGLLREESYVDKPFLNRVHSGEAFGDGGLVFAMLWGLALAALSCSGLIIYLGMRRRNPTGLQKIFW
jgi:uncharacterized iron-regulated membrane protein